MQQAYAACAAGCQWVPHGALATGSGSSRVCSTPPVQLACVWCDASLLPPNMLINPSLILALSVCTTLLLLHQHHCLLPVIMIVRRENWAPR